MHADQHRHATYGQTVWIRTVPHGSQAEKHCEQPVVHTAHSESHLEGQHSHSDDICRSDVVPFGSDERVDVLGDTPSRCERFVCARISPEAPLHGALSIDSNDGVEQAVVAKVRVRIDTRV